MQGLIDLNSLEPLQKLEQEMGKTIIPELIQNYLVDSVNMKDSINSFLKEKNFNSMAEIAHTLKSSSAYLGAQKVRKLAAEIEYLIKENDIVNEADLEILVEQMNRYIPLTIDALKVLHHGYQLNDF